MNGLVSTGYAAAQVQRHVLFTTLVRYDSLLRFRPYLARSWEISDDTTEVVFRLREDVRWHDGEPTTAEDVAFTFRRARDPDVPFPNRSYFARWDSVEVVDRHTLRFHLRPVYAPLLGWVHTPIMPQHVLGDVPPGELFKQVAEFEQFALTEMSLSTYTLWTARGDCPYVGIPAFPSRFFRHSAIYVNDDAGIDGPESLVGRRVGVMPEYQITAATWVRGLLQDEYGVDPEDLRWYVAREEKLPVELTEGLEKQVVDAADDLEAMLESGRLDALVSTLIPDALGDGVSRLFADFKQAEIDYYQRTGLFPIMHTVLLHEDVYERHPWVANAVYGALVEAKEQAIDRLYNTDALAVTLPFLIDHLEEARAVFGDDYWPYGFEPNYEAVDALTDYSVEQGLSDRKVEPEELFVEALHHTGPERATRVKPD
jgi:4,5-dihydroxyphthalate decarboxylase